jgi:SAM-dependent methyltransferase
MAMHPDMKSGMDPQNLRQLFSPLPKAKELIKKITPWQARRWLRKQERRMQHSLLPLRRVSDFGSFRRLRPIGADFGWSRGRCIDRYYIDRFLSDHAEDIRGTVLEFQDDSYTKRFGGTRVTKSAVLDLTRGNPQATIVADITQGDHLPRIALDCIICTQVLQLVFDMNAALRNLCKLLKPGGVLLLTAPGIAHKVLALDQGEDCWRFTTVSMQRLLGEAFGKENVRVRSYGNVLAAIAFLHGLAAEEMMAAELDYFDPEFQVTVAGRAVKG